ncbi:hypothetical protein ACI2LF_23960 [Kribbella sp. NPDC020789]
MPLIATRAAVDLLVDAWAPPGPPDRVFITGDLQSAGHDDCDCTCADDAVPGTVPACGHTKQCVCIGCFHDDHRKEATCSLAGCGQPTALRITPWSLFVGGSMWNASPDDPAAGPTGRVAVGDSRQQHAPLFACGTTHAKAMIATDQQNPKGPQVPLGKGRPMGRFYEVTVWRYEPDQVDVPEPINQVHGHLDYAREYAAQAMAARYTGNDAEHSDNLAKTQRSLAWALTNLIDHLEHITTQSAGPAN